MSIITDETEGLQASMKMEDVAALLQLTDAACQRFNQRFRFGSISPPADGDLEIPA